MIIKSSIHWDFLGNVSLIHTIVMVNINKSIKGSTVKENVPQTFCLKWCNANFPRKINMLSLKIFLRK